VGLDLKRTAPTAALAVSCKKFSSEEAQKKVVRLTLKVFKGLDHTNSLDKDSKSWEFGGKMGIQGPGRALWTWICEKHISHLHKRGERSSSLDVQYQSTDIDSLESEHCNRLISA
jgi:hypothetical protein